MTVPQVITLWIGGLYWTVDYIRDQNLTLRDRNGKPAPAFNSSNLMGAVCLTISGEGCHTLLFNKERPAYVQRLVLSNSENKDPLTMDFRPNKTFELNGFPKDFKPDIVYWVGSATIDMLSRDENGFILKRFQVEYDLNPENYSLTSDDPTESPWKSFSSDGQVMASQHSII